MPMHVSFLGITHDEAVRLASTLAWPAVTVLLAIIFRRPLVAFFEGFAGWAKGSLSKVSLPGGIAFELAHTSEFKIDWTGPGGEDIRNTVAIGQFASDSKDALSLLRPQQLSPAADYAVFVLGSGKRWLTSRLHLFSMVLSRMHGLRYCVFVYDEGDVGGRYLGFASAEAVRWSMAMHYPHLEQATCQALLNLKDNHRITSSTGALDPQSATMFINNYLAAIQVDLEFALDKLVYDSIPAFATTILEANEELPEGKKSPETKVLARFLLGKFSASDLRDLKTQSDWQKQQTLRNKFVSSLSQILQEDSLYDKERYTGITLSEPANRLAGLKPEGEDRVLLNRLLLQQAFPDFVVPVNVPPDFTSFSDKEWVKLNKRDYAGNIVGKVWEHARWLDREYTERLLGAELGRAELPMSTLQTASRKDQVSIILRAESPMVAVVDSRGRFVRLIDRFQLASRAMEFSL